MKGEFYKFYYQRSNDRKRISAVLFCQGSVTNVACALLKKPEIAKRITVISILGGGEFNLQNDDYKGVNLLLSSGTDLWQVPNNCYTKMRVSYAELQEKVLPCVK